MRIATLLILIGGIVAPLSTLSGQESARTRGTVESKDATREKTSIETGAAIESEAIDSQIEAVPAPSSAPLRRDGEAALAQAAARPQDPTGDERASKPQGDAREDAGEAPEDAEEAPKDKDGAVSDSTGPNPVIYEVWMRHQAVHRAPYGYAPRTLVRKGTKLKVVETKGDWNRVVYTTRGREATGWAKLPPARRSAGELAGELGAAVASSVAFVLKGFGELAAHLEREDTGKASRFDELRRASLEPGDVDEFAKRGRLLAPSGRR